MAFLEEAEIRRRLERHTAWHRQELRDGPLVMLAVADDEKAVAEMGARLAPPTDAESLRKWWTEPQAVVGRIEEIMGATTFLGDALPHYYVNLGPSVIAACISESRTVYGPNTIWQEPVIEDWSTAPQLALREDSFLWQTWQALTRASVEAARGRWVTSASGSGGALDTTSCLRTPEKLCFDLIEHPDEVKQAEAAILKAALEVYERLGPVARERWGGTSDWAGLWCAGRNLMLQSDFSCMIGPEMFREFMMPMLEEQTAALDVASYHLDGPGAIRHLDDLLTIPKLRAIQWIPGDGQSFAVRDWLELYRRILDSGRAIQIFCRKAEELDVVFDKLDPDRVAIWYADDAGKTMARVERLRAGRKKAR